MLRLQAAVDGCHSTTLLYPRPSHNLVIAQETMLPYLMVYHLHHCVPLNPTLPSCFPPPTYNFLSSPNLSHPPTYPIPPHIPRPIIFVHTDAIPLPPPQKVRSKAHPTSSPWAPCFTSRFLPNSKSQDSYGTQCGGNTSP